MVKKTSAYKYLILLILAIAAFLRLFRINELLGFWYDQGRDALVIWDFIHKGKTFLLGPMMGFTGMFRGGWYYWLISPFYYLGKGNPLWPDIFLIIISIVAIFVLYKLGEMMGDKKTGIFAALISSVSYYLIGASRWLSDPTPTLLVSVILVWSLFRLIERKIWALPLIGLLVGLSLQFSAAAEIFYIPAILIILWLEKKKLPKIKIIILSVISFLIVFIPQCLFEIRHPGVLSSALFQFVFHEKTFTLSFWQIIGTRLPFDYNLFYSKFWTNGGMFFGPFFVVFMVLIFYKWKKLWKDEKFKIIFILSVAPFIGTLFFIGNLGSIYDYYFTGYYLIWILLFSFVFMSSFKNIFIKVIIYIFISILVFQNLITFKQNYFVSLNGPNVIAFSNQLAAIDWIYKDAGNNEFNVDEYVPPVIPYAYQYLFEWLGTSKYNKIPSIEPVPILYTIEETDPDHPERIAAWFERQKGIGEVQTSKKFGGITVERRLRINEK